MAMDRRDTFKLAGVAAAAAVIPTMATASEKKAAAKKATGKSVVIIGAGFGGLTMAKALRKSDKSIDVTVIEKRSMH
ncbi:MAG TPA: NAD(P)/FAD-dependent oxidoreductase, partial [Sulfurovum sp.]|nr:NAD(P)/FAD-dependent oxidoreductase [Sulfurovum sp.]